MEKTIFLIGYMASGKTTLGRAFARAAGREFIDLDQYITRRFRKTIPEIFAEKGEEGFRQLERNMLREAGAFNGVVVSCGGGTPCFYDNMEFMNANGVTVWLKAGVECIVRRILCAKTRRPITEGKTPEELPAFVAAHLRQREPYYSQAQLTLGSEDLETASGISATVATLQQRLHILQTR